MKDLILKEFQKRWTVTERDTGKYHILKRSGMKFVISAFRIEGFGSMSVIDMSAMLGLMQMESFIITAEEKDLPLFSGDFIKAMGRCTLLEEFYDTMITPLDPETAENYRKVKAQFTGFPAYETVPRWYDSIRYDFTLGVVDRSLKEKKEMITAAYLDAYLKHAGTAAKVDPALKKAKTREYVDGLFANGGPAVNQFKKLFGDAAAREIFGRFVFSCD